MSGWVAICGWLADGSYPWLGLYAVTMTDVLAATAATAVATTAAYRLAAATHLYQAANASSPTGLDEMRDVASNAANNQIVF